MQYKHQYVNRKNNNIYTENFIADRVIKYLYSTTRENAPYLFDKITRSKFTNLLGYINFDLPISKRTILNKFINKFNIDANELVDSIESFTTTRKFFERKIKYWKYRPMLDDSCIIVSPADAKLLIGSFDKTSLLFIKDKFFSFPDLIGNENSKWYKYFNEGEFAIFRLTPDKYHYNHSPVTGKVVDIYELNGNYHSCNPTAIIEIVTPFSKNKRIVTIIDTDIEGGSHIGYVAMIEVVALMIGKVVQCYSEEKYNNPKDIKPGMIIKKGKPKSLYKPGSSTDILIFQRNKISFDSDIVNNLKNNNLENRFKTGFNIQLNETEVEVRSQIAKRKI